MMTKYNFFLKLKFEDLTNLKIYCNGIWPTGQQKLQNTFVKVKTRNGAAIMCEIKLFARAEYMQNSVLFPLSNHIIF
jgi:hypothetical protein